MSDVGVLQGGLLLALKRAFLNAPVAVSANPTAEVVLVEFPQAEELMAQGFQAMSDPVFGALAQQVLPLLATLKPTVGRWFGAPKGSYTDPETWLNVHLHKRGDDWVFAIRRGG